VLVFAPRAPGLWGQAAHVRGSKAVAYWFEYAQNWRAPIRVAADDLLHDFEVIRANQVLRISAHAQPYFWPAT